MNPRFHQSNILIYKKSKSHMSFDLEHLMYYLRLTSEHKQSNNNETANWAESGKHPFWLQPSEILKYPKNCKLHTTLIQIFFLNPESAKVHTYLLKEDLTSMTYTMVSIKLPVLLSILVQIFLQKSLLNNLVYLKL